MHVYNDHRSKGHLCFTREPDRNMWEILKKKKCSSDILRLCIVYQTLTGVMLTTYISESSLLASCSTRLWPESCNQTIHLYSTVFAIYYKYVLLFHLSSSLASKSTNKNHLSETFLTSIIHRMRLFIPSQIVMKENPRKRPREPPNSAMKDWKG